MYVLGEREKEREEEEGGMNEEEAYRYLPCTCIYTWGE